MPRLLTLLLAFAIAGAVLGYAGPAAAFGVGLALVGGAIGGAIGGSVLGISSLVIGRAVGAIVGNYLDNLFFAPKPQDQQGPRLEDPGVQLSTEGTAIPLVFGRARVAGNVIWAGPWIEVAETRRVRVNKKRSQSVTEYRYFRSFAVALAQGPITSIDRIWADGKVVEGGSGDIAAVRRYLGGNDQSPDPLIVADKGAGATPAFRGTAYMVFERWDLTKRGGTLPNVSVEIVGRVEPSGFVIRDGYYGLNTAAGLTGIPRRYAVSPPRAYIENLRAVEGGALAVGRSGSAIRMVEMRRSEEAIQIAAGPLLANAGGPDQRFAVSPSGQRVAVFFNNATTAQASVAIYDRTANAWGPQIALPGSPFSATGDVAWLGETGLVALGGWTSSTLAIQRYTLSGLTLTASGTPVQLPTIPGATQHRAALLGLFQTETGAVHATYNAPTATAVRTVRIDASTISSPTVSVDLAGATGIYAAPLNAGAGPHARWVVAVDRGVLGTLLWEVEFSAGVLSVLGQATGEPTVLNSVFSDGLFKVLTSGNRWHAQRIGDHSPIPAPSAWATFAVFEPAPFVSPAPTWAINLGFNAGQTSTALWKARFVSGATVAQIIRDLALESGLQASDLSMGGIDDEISGYIVSQPMAARNAIEPLTIYTDGVVVESGGILRGIRIGGAPVASIPAEHLAARFDGEQSGASIQRERRPVSEMLSELTLRWSDPAKDYQAGAVTALRETVEAQATSQIDLAIVMTEDRAYALAHNRLYRAWQERESLRLRVPIQYVGVDPGDTIEAAGVRLRVQQTRLTGSLIEISGVPVFGRFEEPISGEIVAPEGLQTYQPPPLSEIIPLDLPALAPEADGPGLYAAVRNLEPARTWPGASLVRSEDGGATWTTEGTAPALAIQGTALTVLPAPAGGRTAYWDRSSTVEVQVEGGLLDSTDEADVLNGANLAALGGEIVGFATATLLAPGRYRLSGLLRGRFGTEHAVGTHAIGERFVLLEESTIAILPLPQRLIGIPQVFAAASNGRTIDDAPDVAFTPTGETMRPLSPAHLRGVRDPGTGDLAVSWVRRARINSGWLDFADVALDEPFEAYRVRVLNGVAVVREETVSAPSWAYSAAAQAADFGGSAPPTVRVAVAQISARVGPGREAAADL